MVSIIAKIKKTLASLSQASMVASDQQSISTLSAAFLIGSNDDLLTEILHRLPAASILLFKSVSKHWQWLLSQRQFIRMHDHLLKTSGFFTTANVYVPFDVGNQSAHPFRSHDFFFDSDRVRILQSCNGLLLCCSDRMNLGGCKYYVFNPTTKQYEIIKPVPGGYIARNTTCSMGLAFHQTDCVHYKLVCIRSLEPDGDLFQIQIYSSDTWKWKNCIQSFYMDWSIFNKAVYWNGAIHWTPYHNNHFYFTIKTEQLQTVPFPVGMMMTSSETRTVYVGESRGHLHVILGNDYGKTGLHMNVYEMLSDCSEWFVKYQVELDGLPTAFPECYYDFKVIDVVRGEIEEDTFIVLITKSKRLIRYNVHDKSFRKIFNLIGPVLSSWVEVHRYIETLSSF